MNHYLPEPLNLAHVSPDLVQTEVFKQVTDGVRILQCILVTVKLGIAEALKEGPQSVSELAAATQTHLEPLHRLLRVLVSFGMLAETSPQSFELTQAGRCLLENHPHSLYHTILLSEELYEPCWKNLSYTLQTGRTAFERTYGMGFHPYLQQQPMVLERFNRAVRELSTMYDAALVSAYDFSAYQRVADIGGGQGSFLVTILQRHPSLTGILFEQPATLPEAQKFLEQQGVIQRCQVIGGDFLEAVPTGADLYVVKNTLNDWEDQEAAKILQNCRQAINSQGRLLIIQRLLANTNSLNTELLNLNKFLVRPAGVRIRTVEEFQTLFQATGFQLNRVIPSTTEMSIVEAIPL